MKLIDVHNHALFGVDDGAKTIEDSILMIDQAIKNNVQEIILTPHFNKRNKSIENVEENFNRLKEAIKDKPIKIYLGREMRFYELEKKPIYYTMNGTKHVLVEFDPITHSPIEEVCYSLRVKGYKPIVAHIERYHYLTVTDYNKIKKFAEVQVNADAVLGISNIRKDYKITKYLLKHKIADYVGSDAHDTTKRKNNLLKAYKRVKRKYGIQYANYIFYENAKKITENPTV